MLSGYTYKFHVDMSCIACVAKVREVLKECTFVKDLEINLSKKTVKVITKNLVHPDSIKKKLTQVKKTELISSPGEINTAYEADWSIDCPESMIQEILSVQRWCQGYEYDPHGKRTRIRFSPRVTNREDKVNKAFSKFHVRKIDNHDRNYLFRIQGLTTQNGEVIRNALNEKKAYIKSPAFINSETSVVSILANIEPGKLEPFVKMLNAHVKKKLREANLHKSACKLEYIKFQNNEQVAEEKADTYFNRAIINLIYCTILFFAGPYIGLPLTLMGQVVGLGVGLATLGVMWKTGKEFYKEAWTDFIQNGSFNMCFLIALGTGSAWIYSMTLVFFPTLFLTSALQYQFFPISMILMIINYGRGIRQRVQENSDQLVQSQIETYAQYQPQFADIVKVKTLNVSVASQPRNHQQLYYKSIRKNDIILVQNGKRFPIDGIIVSKTDTSVEQSALTGEHKSVAKKQGGSVFGGSLNIGNPVLIRATCDSKDSRLTKILKEVKKAKSSRPSMSALIDKIANIFVPAIVVIAALSGMGWLILGPAPQVTWALKSVMSVLLCACPCAMGLSIIPISLGVCEMFNKKIIVRDASVTEALAEVDTVVLDKTGTLTTPQVKEIDISRHARISKDKIMLAVAKLEKESHKSEHPIAQALIQCGLRPIMADITVSNQVESDTQGVSGIVTIDGEQHYLTLGSYPYLTEKKKCTVSNAFKKKGDDFLGMGMTATYIAIDKKCIGIVSLEHEPRKGAKKMIEGLKKLGIDAYMLTGDKKGPALNIAKKLGIDKTKVISDKDENGKQEYIVNLQKAGRKVAMVGDGVNDLLALEKADIRVSAGAYTNTAPDCQLALQKLNIDIAIIIARETMKNIKQNLGWTLFYNIISLTAATGLLYPIWGIVLNPVLASLLMALSSIFVIINSNRLSFEIKDKISFHEEKVIRAANIFEKIKDLFSLRSFGQTILMLANMSDSVRPKPPVLRVGEQQDLTKLDIASPGKVIFSAKLKKKKMGAESDYHTLPPRRSPRLSLTH